MNNGAMAQLTQHEQALVAVAILIDGNDAAAVLAIDSTRGEQLKAAAQELGAMEIDTRLPFIGTLLRRALEGER